MGKVIEYKNRKIELISRKEFGTILGVSVETIKKWVANGIILPPAFQDSNNTAYNFGRGEVPRKFYVVQEALMVRAVMKEFDMGKGKKIQQEFIDKAIKGMLHVRELVNEAHPSVEDKAIILEFNSYKDLEGWLSQFDLIHEDDVEPLSRMIYQLGNKYI